MDNYCTRTGPMYVKSVMDGPWNTKDKSLKGYIPLNHIWIKEAKSSMHRNSEFCAKKERHHSNSDVKISFDPYFQRQIAPAW